MGQQRGEVKKADFGQIDDDASAERGPTNWTHYAQAPRGDLIQS